MFHFLHSMFDRDDGVEAVPLLPEEDPVLSTQSTRVVDIDGLLAQASTKVAVGRLRKLGKKMVSLLSRSKIDQLINQAIRRHVERTRAGDGPGSAPPPGYVNADIRKEFDSLLSQHLGSALDGDGSPEGRTFEVVDGRLRPEVSLDRLELEPGRGLHVETFNICSAGRVKSTGETVFTAQRNAFLKVVADESTKKVLQQLELGFVAHGDSGYIVGDPAIELGRIFGKIPRRPMQKGMLSPDEPVALFILSLLLRQLVGTPGKPGEICVYSVPADPIEGDRNFIYHLGALESALKTLGYTPRPMMESHLLVSSELKDQDYTGIGVTCGAGMFNVGIAYKGLPVLSFSTFQGGGLDRPQRRRRARPDHRGGEPGPGGRHGPPGTEGAGRGSRRDLHPHPASQHRGGDEAEGGRSPVAPDLRPPDSHRLRGQGRHEPGLPGALQG